jgi:hypothetical protein
MFVAAIIACLVSVPDSCITFVDNRGPYDTEAECLNRTLEMAQSAANIAGEPVRVQRGCIPNKGQST